MSLVDVGIVLFVIALGAVGYERGLIASALPLAGFIGGAALGARVGPELLSQGAQSQYAPLVATITGSARRGLRRGRAGRGHAAPRDATAGERRPAPRRDRRRAHARRPGAARLLGLRRRRPARDRVRDLREAVQRSTILGALNDVLPPSGPLLHVLRRVDPTPSVRGPNADVAPPDPSLGR